MFGFYYTGRCFPWQTYFSKTETRISLKHVRKTEKLCYTFRHINRGRIPTFPDGMPRSQTLVKQVIPHENQKKSGQGPHKPALRGHKESQQDSDSHPEHDKTYQLFHEIYLPALKLTIKICAFRKKCSCPFGLDDDKILTAEAA